MDLRHLRSFIATAEELHFQRAARRLALSQPALSHQIKHLEEQVGVTLLARDHRGVALTPAGAVFLVRAREAIAAVETAVREARDAGGAEPACLRVGYVGYLNLRVIARSLAAFRERRPTVTIERYEMPTEEVYASLKERTIDIGFGVLPVTHPTLRFRTVAEGYWCIVMPEGHVLTGGPTLTLDRLADRPLILFDRALNPPLYDAWMERFRSAGVRPRIVLETNQVQTGLALAADGTGLFLAASYVVDVLPPGLVRRRFDGFDTAIAVGAAWHEDNRSRVLADYLVELRRAPP